ncbi:MULTISPECIES: DMT family transporter [unclassified Methylobacterium]|uniref:DMT family transporter n=1 Tax=unclassified Methylobacterium TaxID=2615210 RepID=UPI001FBB8955|nr:MULTISPECIES: DMT family transporter [unclassified Methylobacterium]MCJ2095169.1 DMT family transporter [Methylobacterium sp. J-072]MCJ2139374.1 DMT family transporter [Methylobacterium sp. E-066]
MLTPAPRPSLAASALPVLFVPIWATGFISARAVIPHADPLGFTAVRFTGVALLLALIAAASRVRWPGTQAGWRDPMVAGFLMQGVYLSGVFWAVSRGLPAGIAALVGSLQPLLTALLAGPLLGERVSGRRALGILLGFAGAGLVLAPKLGAADPSGIPPVALAVSLVAVLALTLGTLWQKRTGGGGDLLANATLQFVGGMACAIPLALAFGHATIDPVAPLWLGLAWAILVNSVAGILLLLALIRRGAVAGVAALFFLVPPVAAVLGYVLFGEVLTLVQVAGMAVAALGVAVASRA